MKIIYISEGNLPSQEANSIQVAKMAQAFAQKVEDFELITLGDLWSLVQNNRFDFQNWYGLTKEYKITQLPLLCRNSYPFPRKYRNKFRSQHFSRWAAFYAAMKSPDLVYTRSKQAAKIALSLGLNILYEWHLPVKDGFFPKQTLTKRNFLGLVTISQQLASEYVTAGLPLEKVIVEHDGVDLTHFLPYQLKEEARQKLQLSLSIPIVVYAGHLYDFKGIPTIYQVAQLMPNCLFLLLGGWQHDIEQARKVCQRDRLFNVKIIGHVPQTQLPTYLYASDVLILPNSGKHVWSATTSPLKLFEYMATHRPIVASALPNITTVLQHKKNALLAEPDCPQSFKQAVEELLINPQMGKSLAEQAFQDVQYYTWEQRAERILQFFTKKLQENHYSTQPNFYP
ncbi:glycosyl transferase group 1 [Gloeocapsa sp. PCC 7428]|uniref:glycosyltransferase n=1 Tax=Gloeocapsa sp. PCC 7428 TaxID=1173026 RepID=UPI0002A5BCF8|nr:glycosyltransferase [Gloeocapsa sp. PCC 7428]AFZ29977.1 glycosyl transferase group 1 [Gloeocapsa sp. PCC 7428]